LCLLASENILPEMFSHSFTLLPKEMFCESSKENLSMHSVGAPSHANHVSSFTSFVRAMTRRSWLTGFLLIGLWLAGVTAAVSGQSALDGFDPNANGTVQVVFVQPDGKILIGGSFTTLTPNGGAAVTRNRIARLNPDGTLDTAFNPNASSTVFAIAVQADGRVLVGGNFTTISGQPRNFIARLNATTGLVDPLDPFNPNANGSVVSFAVQADGMILAGGGFSTIGGQTRSKIARLNATSGLADSFDPNADGSVESIVVQADGKILAGGGFSIIGGQTRNQIARLHPDGTLDTGFDPNADNNVFSIAVQADGKILAGGSFTTIGGQSRSRIARLDATTGAADTSFDPNANITVNSIAVQADGHVLAGGNFTTIGGQTRNHIARLNTDGTLDTAFDPNANGNIESIALQSDSKILAAGAFTTLAPNGGVAVSRNRIARLETDGRLDQTLDLNMVGGSNVVATAVQPDGKILLGGHFNSVLGVTRNNIARLNTDGTLDTAFDPNANDGVASIAVQTNGKILVGGEFSGANSIGGRLRNHIARLDATTGMADLTFDPNLNGEVDAIAVQADNKILAGGFFTGLAPNGGAPVARHGIVRLNPDGTLDTGFDPNANSGLESIAVQADGKILVGGAFTNIGGQPRNRIARLDATTGAAELSFDPNALGGDVFAITLQPDGKILAGGDFTAIGGQPRNFVARLDATTGAADMSFDPNASQSVTSIALQADGQIVAGGAFTTIGGQPRNRIARLNATSGAADSFDPNANSSVNAVAVQADGKILAGGAFISIGGQPRILFARLTNDTAALQNLAVTQTTITWTRDGSSQQFTRVTFEYSDDNVNYSPLGSGTAAGSNWTRTGLNLSTGKNFYIRARGYYRSGYQNGSESIVESVRNAFNAGPTSSESAISGRILTDDNKPIPGTGVNLTGTQTRKTITDESGNYRFDNVETGGFYTVSSSRANYSFSPAGRSFSQVGNTTEVSFTGTPDVVIIGNSIDTPEYFVRQHYLDFLGREPDESGFNFWSDQLLDCGADAGCLERRRINVSAAYFLSIEFQQTGGLVDGLYKASYGVRPQFAEFMPDTRTIAENVVVGRTGWEQQLYLNKQAFVEAFVQRPEFRSAYDNLANDAYVDTLIAHTGVAFAQSERDALVSDLAGTRLTRAAVLLRIAADERFATARHNEAFVMMEYFGYLRRDPDESGYAFWLNKLNQFDGNFERAEMVKAFLVSIEYRSRFGQQ
jgi:uncharacterized delta-60 repeat protein